MAKRILSNILKRIRTKVTLAIAFIYFVWHLPKTLKIIKQKRVQALKDENVKIIGINLAFNDKMEDVTKVLEDNNIEFPILFDDGAVASAYGIRSIPTNVLINKDGIVEENIIGICNRIYPP